MVLQEIRNILQNYKTFRKQFTKKSSMYIWCYTPVEKDCIRVSSRPYESISERKKNIAYYFGSSGKGLNCRPAKLPRKPNIIIFRYNNTFLVPSNFCTGLVTVNNNELHVVKALKGKIHILINNGNYLNDKDSILELDYLYNFAYQGSKDGKEDCRGFAPGTQYILMTTGRCLFYYNTIQLEKEEDEYYNESTPPLLDLEVDEAQDLSSTVHNESQIKEDSVEMYCEINPIPSSPFIEICVDSNHSNTNDVDINTSSHLNNEDLTEISNEAMDLTVVKKNEPHIKSDSHNKLHYTENEKYVIESVNNFTSNCESNNKPQDLLAQIVYATILNCEPKTEFQNLIEQSTMCNFYEDHNTLWTRITNLSSNTKF